MQVDRVVTREKYEREVAILRRRYAELAKLGCYVVRAEFPVIDVIVTPTKQVAFGIASLPPAATVDQTQAVEQQLHVQQYGVPPRFSFTLMPFGIRVHLDDYDLRAPSFTFHHAATWELLPVAQLPAAVLESEGKEMGVLLGDHPVTKASFFCMRGVREYHEHPEHTNDEWLRYRGSITVYATLTKIVQCCEKPIPLVIVTPPQLAVRFIGVS